jgi:energy-coupling factor transporter ATP-binding protein EcfA2
LDKDNKLLSLPGAAIKVRLETALALTGIEKLKEVKVFVDSDRQRQGTRPLQPQI